jgi:HAD superfamily hydrolase (TIGR01509 family)
MIKAVIFDVDGTLIDSVDAHATAWQEALRDFGHDIPFADVRAQIGKGGDQLLKVFLSEQEIEQDGDKIEKARKNEFQKNHLPKIRAFPATRELFKRLLADGKRVALASSAAGDELDAYKKKARIDDLVDKETSKDDAKKSKPHPDIFEAALEKFGNPSLDETAVVGDSPWDAIAAKKIGLRCIGVRCGGFPEDALRANGCDSIFDDPQDLLGHYAEVFSE